MTAFQKEQDKALKRKGILQRLNNDVGNITSYDIDIRQIIKDLALKDVVVEGDRLIVTDSGSIIVKAYYGG
jgi:hypothetical protein